MVIFKLNHQNTRFTRNKIDSFIFISILYLWGRTAGTCLNHLLNFSKNYTKTLKEI